MRSKLYTCNKGKIVSARISDDELENVRQLMELTNLTPSEIMRKAFHLQIERFNQTPIPNPDKLDKYVNEIIFLPKSAENNF